MTSRWIARRPEKPRAQLRLFCLPYAGGSAALYRSWHGHFPESIDLCPVELPGRLARRHDPVVADIAGVVGALDEAATPLLDIPFAFFGYSMGAVLAYEWAHRVSIRQRERFRHLIVAARPAPHLAPRQRYIHPSMTEEEFVDSLGKRYGNRLQPVLAHAELRAHAIGVMRSDLGMLDAYVHEQRSPLDTPITAIGGTDDTLVPHQDLHAWGQLTGATFTPHQVPGDHFFIQSRESDLPRLIVGALLREVAPRTSCFSAHPNGNCQFAPR